MEALYHPKKFHWSNKLPFWPLFGRFCNSVIWCFLPIQAHVPRGHWSDSDLSTWTSGLFSSSCLYDFGSLSFQTCLVWFKAVHSVYLCAMVFESVYEFCIRKNSMPQSEVLLKPLTFFQASEFCIISPTETTFQPYAVLDAKLKAVWNVRSRITENTNLDCLGIWQRLLCSVISVHLAIGRG